MFLFRRIAILLLTLLLSLHGWCVTSRPGSASELKVKGDALYDSNRYSEALEYYTSALDKAKADKDSHIYNACIGNISNIYAIMGDPQRSLYYQKLGFKSSAESGDSAMMWRFAVNIVAQYCLKGEPDNAQVFFKKQMQLSSGKPADDQYYKFYNQGMIAQVEKKLDEAIYYYKAALLFAVEHKMEPQFIISQYQSLGMAYMSINQYDNAIQQYLEAEKLAKQSERIEKIDQVYNGLATIYNTIGDTINAEKYKAKHLAISDSLYNRKRFSTASGKLFEYENTENQKHIDRLVSRNNTQLLIILAVLLFAGIVTWLYMALRRKNRNLQEAQRLLIRKNDELMKSDAQNRNLLQLYAQSPKDEATTQEAATPAQDDNRNDLGLTQEAINQLLRRITDVMDQVDVISDKDFGLAQLTQMVGSNVKYVSRVINEVYGKNFKTFLNEYRIKEACKRLRDHENYGNMTIQAIYQDVGFQSAASFINAFKKSMGMTPSTFQKLAREQQTTAEQDTDA